MDSMFDGYELPKQSQKRTQKRTHSFWQEQAEQCVKNLSIPKKQQGLIYKHFYRDLQKATTIWRRMNEMPPKRDPVAYFTYLMRMK